MVKIYGVLLQEIWRGKVRYELRYVAVAASQVKQLLRKYSSLFPSYCLEIYSINYNDVENINRWMCFVEDIDTLVKEACIEPALKSLWRIV